MHISLKGGWDMDNGQTMHQRIESAESTMPSIRPSGDLEGICRVEPTFCHFVMSMKLNFIILIQHSSPVEVKLQGQAYPLRVQLEVKQESLSDRSICPVRNSYDDTSI